MRTICLFALSLLALLGLCNIMALGQESGFEEDVFPGSLLIARPGMVDPVFQHSVILIFHHTGEGTLGIIINHPIGVRSLAGVLKAVGEDPRGVRGSVPIYAGGPMEIGMAFVLVSADYRGAGTVNMDGRIAITTNPRIFGDIGNQRGPRRYLIALGYAGWGPGQLEMELADHDWSTATEDPALVFDEDRTKVWQDALARRGRAI